MRKLFKRFKDDEFIFEISTGFKVAGIFVFLFFLSSYLIWLITTLHSSYFEANQLIGGMNQSGIYKDYILRNSSDFLPYVGLFLVVLFFGGIYIAKMLIRPFKEIEKYAIAKTEGDKSITYEPDNFSEYKLLTRFSEFFFQYLSDCEENKELSKSTIPPQYLKVHKPPFDKVFFFHFSLIILIIAICNFMFLSSFLNELNEGLVSLMIEMFKEKQISTNLLIKELQTIFSSLNIMISVILVIYYLILSVHLYGKVSGAIFGYFSTMRSFMKGNTNARVHLLGYNHIRSTGRNFNKYLKTVCDKVNHKKDSK